MSNTRQHVFDDICFEFIKEICNGIFSLQLEMRVWIVPSNFSENQIQFALFKRLNTIDQIGYKSLSDIFRTAWSRLSESNKIVNVRIGIRNNTFERNRTC